MPLLLHAHMRTDHLIPGLIFLGGSCNMQQSGIKAGQVANSVQVSWYLPAFALRKPLSERLSAVCITSHDGGESSAACVHQFLFVWGKLVLKHMKCCKQLSKSPV